VAVCILVKFQPWDEEGDHFNPVKVVRTCILVWFVFDINSFPNLEPVQAPLCQEGVD